MKPTPTGTALLEIGMEELPARFLDPALAQLAQLMQERLSQANLPFSSIETFGTPRGLAVMVHGVAMKANDRVDEAVGPPPKAAKDEAGNWTQAALGFAKAQKVSPDKLVVKQTPKGERLVALHPVKGQKAEVVLKDVFPNVIRSLTFPKSMVWEESRFRFARPIRRILALFNSKVVRFRVAGIASDRSTIGLLALGGHKITVSKPERYKIVLKGRCVLVDQKERQAKIERELESIAKRVKGRPVADAEHVREVVNLTAYPVAILGQFHAEYLSLPREILTVVLRKHQKFFPIESSKGQLSNYFVGVRNGPSEYQEDVREGYERVVHARFADAKFFFAQDSKQSLEDLARRLSGVGFNEKLGSMWDKTVRVRQLASGIALRLGLDESKVRAVDRAALLAKADLLTQMVGEFPELQGVAGRFYADGKESPEVAAALEQHHWPLVSEGKLPAVEEAAVVAVADKIDTLAADFSVGLIPSGSADPYGLRRMALGVIRILLARRWSLPLDELIAMSFAMLPGDAAAKEKWTGELKEFFVSRCANWFREQGYRVDEVEAVFSARNSILSVLSDRLAGLKAVRGKPEFGTLAGAIKRARNLISQARDKGVLPSSANGLSADQLSSDAEKSLLSAVQSAQPRVQEAVGAGRFKDAFLELATLKGPVDAFFDGVMVMVEDSNVRDQRLRLLMQVKELFDELADFSKLQAAGA